MPARIIQHFWSLRNEFAKYFIIGIGAVILDVGSLYVLKEYGHLSATLAVVVYQPLLIISVFLANKHWSFKANGMAHRQFMRFVLLAVANYLFSVGWIYVFHERLEANYLAVRLANIILAVGWNFLLYKYWVYRDEKPGLEKTA